MFRPGAALRDIHATCLGAVHRAGFASYARGHFGHGLGASIWSEVSTVRLSVAASGEQHAYGQTIIRLLEGFARPSAMPGLVGILEDKNQMKRRIRMIAQFRRPGRWAWLSGIAATFGR